jgi:hypothetical protein
VVNGSCLCGLVTYEARGPFDVMLNCHCSICRKHHGSGFVTHLAAPLGGFRWLSGEDRLLNYRTSERGERSSCQVCGSPLPVLLPARDLVLLPAGALNGEIGIKPQAHIFVGSKAPWYTITDSLPRHEAYPPGFGTPVSRSPTAPARPGVTAGSCNCGRIAFEIEGDALFMQSCHCTRCRRARGAPHGTNIFFRARQFNWIRGEDLLSDYKLPEAQRYGNSFCSHCGGVMPRVSREHDFVVLPAGCLDTDPPMRPQRHIFTSYKAPWFEITDGLPQFAEGAPVPR